MRCRPCHGRLSCTDSLVVKFIDSDRILIVLNIFLCWQDIELGQLGCGRINGDETMRIMTASICIVFAPCSVGQNRVPPISRATSTSQVCFFIVNSIHQQKGACGRNATKTKLTRIHRTSLEFTGIQRNSCEVD